MERGAFGSSFSTYRRSATRTAQERSSSPSLRGTRALLREGDDGTTTEVGSAFDAAQNFSSAFSRQAKAPPGHRRLDDLAGEALISVTSSRDGV